MDIKQVLAMPVGQKFGGFDVVIKTCKKKWQEASGTYSWMQQVIISDKSGDALADVNIVKNISLQRGSVLHITVAEIQQGVPEVSKVLFKKIYIDQFVLPTDIGEPPLQYDIDGPAGIVDGKIRHGLTCAYIQAGKTPDKSEILKWTKFIITGQ